VAVGLGVDVAVGLGVAVAGGSGVGVAVGSGVEVSMGVAGTGSSSAGTGVGVADGVGAGAVPRAGTPESGVSVTPPEVTDGRIAGPLPDPHRPFQRVPSTATATQIVTNITAPPIHHKVCFLPGFGFRPASAGGRSDRRPAGEGAGALASIEDTTVVSALRYGLRTASFKARENIPADWKRSLGDLLKAFRMTSCTSCEIPRLNSAGGGGGVSR